MATPDEHDRLLNAATEIARVAKDAPDVEQILVMELRWEIDDQVEQIFDIIIEIGKVEKEGDGKWTPEKMVRIRALRKKQDPRYARIKLCHERIAILSNLFPNVNPCGNTHDDEDDEDE